MKMEPLDNFDEKFRSAASHDEQQPFASMERVWERVEAKIDHKELKTENRMWKKWAIAASVLLLGTIGYQILKPETKTESVEIVTTPAPIESIENSAVVFQADTVISSAIKPEASVILQEQIRNTSVAMQEVDAITAPAEEAAPEVPEPPTQIITQAEIKKDESDDLEFGIRTARGVKRILLKNTAEGAAKDEPLYILDGEVSNKTAIQAADAETIVKLEEPLYIINGKEYSEKEMFGPNPTSPYAPLAEQDIESLSILQGKEAVEKYGNKGRKGVVIVKTKDGKPKPKKAK